LTDTAVDSARHPSLRRRLDALSVRWQARFDTAAADRVFPWLAAGGLFLLLAGLSLSRARTLDAGADLGAFTQAAWLIGKGEPAYMTVRGAHLLSEQASFAFYPLAEVIRLVPAIPTLLVLQSAMLALGAVPLWRLARRVCDLRQGAAATLVAAYCLYPPLHGINLDDFHPSSIALPALLGAALFGFTDRWWPYAACLVVAVQARADLAVVVLFLGLLLVLEGKRRPGYITAGAGFAWLVLALLVIQPIYADGQFVHGDAFIHYGSSPAGAAWGMVTNPLRVLGDITTQDNFDLLVMLLAPVFFLPLVAPRYLIPVVPLEIFFFVSNSSELRIPEAEHEVAATAFIFVATTFALARIGERRVETGRLTVDRRLLSALVLASVVFFVRDSPASPYEKPWDWAVRDSSDEARLDAVDLIDDEAPVRASPSLLPLLAEREELYELETGANPHVRNAAEDVDIIAFDGDAVPEWDDERRRLFQEGLEQLGFVRVFDRDGISVYER